MFLEVGGAHEQPSLPLSAIRRTILRVVPCSIATDYDALGVEVHARRRAVSALNNIAMDVGRRYRRVSPCEDAKGHSPGRKRKYSPVCVAALQ